MSLLTLAESAKKYGPITDGKWVREAEFCGLLRIPPDIGSLWENTATGLPVTRIYCNRDMHAPLMQALENVKERGLLKELHSFDGCYMVRLVRGSASKLSWHSYALALDLDADCNGLGTQGTLSPEFIGCFTDAGFIWGGTFSRPDPMHFQWGLG